MESLREVIGIAETVRIDREGEAVKIHRVTAITQSGDRFALDIPDKDFSLEKAEAALRARADEIEAIRNLKG